MINTGAAHSQVRNIKGSNVAKGGYCNAPYVTIDGISLENPTGTADPSVIDTAAVNAWVNNYDVFRAGNVPAGPIGIRFVTAPALRRAFSGAAAEGRGRQHS